MTASLSGSGRTPGRKELGQIGEAAAREYLEGNGWTVVASNWRCRAGEIDLIAHPPEPEQHTLVFIEVRARSSSRFGTAEESVDARKQRKLRQVAQFYLQRHGGAEGLIRFDVIAVHITTDGRVVGIRMLEGVF